MLNWTYQVYARQGISATRSLAFGDRRQWGLTRVAFDDRNSKPATRPKLEKLRNTMS